MALTEKQLSTTALRVAETLQINITDAEAVEFCRCILASLPKPEADAVVDANDDGYWADILPDRGVKVGQLLYTETPIAPPASEQKPIAWATTNEDGDYAMLFFDKQEARSYSGDDEPIGLAPVSCSAPQTDYKAQRDALLKCLALIEPKLDFSGWENGQGEDIGNEINAAIASVKGGA